MVVITHIIKSCGVTAEQILEGPEELGVACFIAYAAESIIPFDS